MKKLIISIVVVLFALCININFNPIYSESKLDISFGIKEASAKEDPAGIWCAEAWGVGITRVPKCDPCGEMQNFCYLWTNDSRCMK
jgi:hypothetical protein